MDGRRQVLDQFGVAERRQRATEGDQVGPWGDTAGDVELAHRGSEPAPGTVADDGAPDGTTDRVGHPDVIGRGGVGLDESNLERSTPGAPAVTEARERGAIGDPADHTVRRSVERGPADGET